MDIINNFNKEKGYEILNDIHEISKELGLTIFLTCGTCLSFVRDKDFLDWERDIDIGIIPNKKPFIR